MPKLTVNGIAVEVPAGATVLQACQGIGVEVAHFCYHERLAIAGNCRMCLVEQEKAPKPIASCAMPAADGMVIHTDSAKAKKARHGVMEFLLINHPLDCPICDQGGECDLQDEAMAYGFDRGRYLEHKRAVPDKDFGPLVETAMTRCIHCTRCIRFLTDVAGVEELGATGRGEHMEIGTYIEKGLSSELSANIIDLCPVGALTSKPYAFIARPWELAKTESVDVLDALGSNIRVDERGGHVLRVLPRLNEDVNEEWISDKTRFALDGLARRRLDRPYIRRNGKLEQATWPEAFAAIAERLKRRRRAHRRHRRRSRRRRGDVRLEGFDGGAGLAASRLPPGRRRARSVVPRGLSFQHHHRRHRPGRSVPPDRRQSARRGGDLERAPAQALAPRRIQGGGRRTRARPHLSRDLARRRARRRSPALAAGRGDWAEALKAAKHPMLILGQGALRRPDGAAVLALARKLAEWAGLVREDWNGFNVLHTAAARVGGLDLGFVPGAGGRDLAGILAGCGSGEIGAVYLLGADEIDMRRLGRAFVIYQGHHGDAGARRADVVLPGAAYTEKDATYVNTEGRVQHARRAVFPPGDAREDWKILRALSEALGRTLPYDSLPALRRRMGALNPVFDGADLVLRAAWGPFGKEGPVEAAPFAYPIADFYRTDPISRASPTMAQCAEALGRHKGEAGTGTHG